MNSLYGNYRQKKLSDVWEDVDEFTLEFSDTPFSKPFLIEVLDGEVPDPDVVNLIYYLLYARYGNDIIASSDINRFKYDLFSIIFNYGPTWNKRLEIQSKLRALSDTDIQDGVVNVTNRSINPSTAPATNAFDALTTVNEQTATKAKRGKLEGYALLWDMLDTDVTEDFIRKFKRLFLTVVQPELPLWYASIEEEEEE